MPKTVLQIVQEAIGKFADMAPENVKVNSTIGAGQDIDLDSLDMVETIMAIEDALNIRIPDEEIKTIRTVQDILDLIRSRQPISP